MVVPDIEASVSFINYLLFTPTYLPLTTLARSIDDGQTILPNHCHARRRTDNSVKTGGARSTIDGRMENRWTDIL